jgi:nicotinate phosphoribosyltransferase
VVSTAAPIPSPSDRPLLVPQVRDGKVVGAEPLAEARERHQRALAELPLYALQLSRGYPAIPTLFEPDGH